MEKIVFSVIIPCYNSENYVTNAIESILNQSYPHWELLLINDGSTDNTLTILEKYAKDDSRIKIFCKENGGYVSAVNMGLDHINGDYFLMMGSDDALENNLFEELFKNIEEELPDAIAFQTIKVKNGEEIGIDEYTSFNTRYAEFDTTFLEFAQKFPMPSGVFFERDTSKCFKREKLGNLRYFGKYGIDADGIFSSLFCHKASSFLIVPVIGYRWTLRSNSLSSNTLSFTTEKQFDRMSNWNLFFTNLLILDNINDKEKRAISRFLNLIYDILTNHRKTISHYSIIKQSIKTVKKAANKFDMQACLPKSFFMLEWTPLLYSIILKMKKRIKRTNK